MFEDHVRDEIKRRISIYDLVSTYERKRVECPNPDCPGRFKNKQETEIYAGGTAFKCYICKSHGDVFTWEQLSTGATYSEAKRNLARNLGICLSPSKERTELLTIVSREAFKYLFSENPEKLKYFEKRGISKSVLWKFGVGYIDTENKVLNATGLTRDQLAHLGLLFKSNSEYRADISSMAGRFIFPIRNAQGHLVQLKGRADAEALGEEIANQKKSIPLKAEPDGSPWGRVSNQDFLFGEEYIEEAKRLGYAIINEGEPDCLTLRTLDFPSFGLQGCEGLSKHASKFKGISRIYVMLDNDAATQHNLLKELYEFQVLLPNETLYVVNIPPLLGHDEEGNVIKVDVNDLKVKFDWTRNDYKSLIENAAEVRSVLIDSWGPHLSNLSLRNRLSRLIISTTNEQLKDKMIARLCELTRKSADAITLALDPIYHDKISASFG